jgi:hypothetical protein
MNTLLGFPEGGSTPPFGRILRQWRGARHLSQLALSDFITSRVIAIAVCRPDNRLPW